MTENTHETERETATDSDWEDDRSEWQKGYDAGRYDHSQLHKLYYADQIQQIRALQAIIGQAADRIDWVASIDPRWETDATVFADRMRKAARIADQPKGEWAATVREWLKWNDHTAPEDQA